MTASARRVVATQRGGLTAVAAGQRHLDTLRVIRRIDYPFATPKLVALARREAIYKDQKRSSATMRR
jgi:hypothetical protein